MLRRLRLSKVAALVVVLGVALTSAVAAAAWVAHGDNEERLLQQRTQEAAAVLEASVSTVETPLAETSTLAEAVAVSDPGTVEQFIGGLVRREQFRSVTVLSSADGAELVSAGVGRALQDPLSLPPPRATEPSPNVTGTVQVVNLLDRPEPGIGYLYTDVTSPRTVVYAEQAAPEPQISPIPPGEAFAGLDYALYLGNATAANLLVASTPDLPLGGSTAEARVGLGDTGLLFVASSTTTYGSALMAALPWLVGAAGVSTTVGGTALVEGMHRRRKTAERLSVEIRNLYDREHAIAHTLQQSLLPVALPELAEVDLAARYVAGAEGTEVGGDWYDVIVHNDRCITLIVGDVVGRGVKAAAVMAGLRYATHTLAALGTAPGELLSTVNSIEGVRGDFATMLCATIDLSSDTLTFGLAGHPPPLLVTRAGSDFAQAPVGPPIGFLDHVTYTDVVRPFERGTTLLLYTDGLYERPGEDIEAGHERLRRAAMQPHATLEAWIDHLYADLVGAAGRDDVAMLAVRRP